MACCLPEQVFESSTSLRSPKTSSCRQLGRLLNRGESREIKYPCLKMIHPRTKWKSRMHQIRPRRQFRPSPTVRQGHLTLLDLNLPRDGRKSNQAVVPSGLLLAAERSLCGRPRLGARTQLSMSVMRSVCWSARAVLTDSLVTTAFYPYIQPRYDLFDLDFPPNCYGTRHLGCTGETGQRGKIAIASRAREHEALHPRARSR